MGVLGYAIAIVAFLALGACPFWTWVEERRHFKQISFVRTMLVVQAWIVLTTLESLRLLFMKHALRQDVRQRAHESCGAIARFILWHFLGGFEVRGAEHLADGMASSTPCVVIANHQSMVDVGAMFTLGLKAGWVAKTAVFCMPGVGWLMYLAGYVPVERKSSTSIKKMYTKCKQCVADGWSMIIFPQGTRSRYNPTPASGAPSMLPFKNGAYNLAAELGLPVLPVAIHIPPDVWSGSSTKIVAEVHAPAFGCTEANKDGFRDATYATLMASLQAEVARTAKVEKKPAPSVSSKVSSSSGGSNVVTSASGGKASKRGRGTALILKATTAGTGVS